MFKKAFRRALFWGAVLVLAFIAIKQVPGRAQLAIEAYESGDVPRAVRIWEKMAKHGDAEAQYNLGAVYMSGQGVERSDEKAYKWMLMAARNGHAAAQFEVGKMYENGLFVAASLATALAWIKKAADQGHDPAETDLGLKYLSGTGVERSAELAAYWLAKVVGDDREPEVMSGGRPVVLTSPCAQKGGAGS